MFWLRLQMKEFFLLIYLQKTSLCYYKKGDSEKSGVIC